MEKVVSTNQYRGNYNAAKWKMYTKQYRSQRSLEKIKIKKICDDLSQNENDRKMLLNRNSVIKAGAINPSWRFGREHNNPSYAVLARVLNVVQIEAPLLVLTVKSRAPSLRNTTETKPAPQEILLTSLEWYCVGLLSVGYRTNGCLAKRLIKRKTYRTVWFHKIAIAISTIA